MTLPTQSVGHRRGAGQRMWAEPGVQPALLRNPFKEFDYVHCMMRTFPWISIIPAQDYCACVYLEGGDPAECEKATGYRGFDFFPWHW